VLALLLVACSVPVDGTPTWGGVRFQKADLAPILLTAQQVEEVTGVQLPEGKHRQ
jgi:hypothetical protein